MNGLGDRPVDQTSRPYGTAQISLLLNARDGLTSTFTFEFQPVLSDCGDFAIPLDLDSITLEFALCVFSQAPVVSVLRELK